MPNQCHILSSLHGDVISSRPTSASAFFIRRDQVLKFLQDPSKPPTLREICGYGNVVVQIMIAAEASFREVKPPTGNTLCLRFETPGNIVVVYAEDSSHVVDKEWLDGLHPHLFVSKQSYQFCRPVGASLMQDFGWDIVKTSSYEPPEPLQPDELNTLANAIRAHLENTRHE